MNKWMNVELTETLQPCFHVHFRHSHHPKQEHVGVHQEDDRADVKVQIESLCEIHNNFERIWNYISLGYHHR